MHLQTAGNYSGTHLEGLRGVTHTPFHTKVGGLPLRQGMLAPFDVFISESERSSY